MAVALALFAAVLWGSGDFLGGTASRRAPVVTVLAASQFVGLLGVSVGGSSPRGIQHPPRTDLLAAVGSGIGGCIGLSALYGGLSVGAMAIVAPISALSPVIPLLADFVQGNRPGAVAIGGIVVALTGVVILSREPGGRSGDRFAAGLGLALVAAVGFGFFTVGLDAASDSSAAWGTSVARLTSTALALTAALVLRAPFGRLRGLVPLVIASVSSIRGRTC